MSQIPYSGNINAANFPFSAAFKGRSVIVAGRDQNNGPYRGFGGNNTDQGFNIPQLYYCENIVPTNEGIKSITFNEFIPPAIAYTGRFIERFTLYDGLSNKALIGITDTYEIWMLSTYTFGIWSKITLPAAAVWSSGIATTGTVFGQPYINLQGLGVYSIDIPTTAFIKETITGASDNTFVGIADSTSYLIAWDPVQIYWSSTSDPTDFTPSLITGAGSGVPEDLQGQIVLVKNISQGFIVYSTVVVIAAIYSGNSQFPWVFKALNNGSGISAVTSVTGDDQLSVHYAYTSGGMLRVTVQSCEPVFPELTDFLSSKVWDTYDSETKTVSTSYLGAPVSVRLAYVGARYFMVSYGRTDSDVGIALEYTLIYDDVLKRWGKSKLDHTQCFEITVDTSGGGITWEDTDPEEWEDSPGPWNSYVEWTNSVAQAKNTIGYMREDGSIAYIDFTFPGGDASAVAILGKFQLTRNSMCTVQRFDLECVDQELSNFAVSDAYTIDGKSYVLPVGVMSLAIDAPNMRRYDSRITGYNHSMVLEGAFHVVFYMLTFSNAGRVR